MGKTIGTFVLRTREFLLSSASACMFYSYSSDVVNILLLNETPCQRFFRRRKNGSNANRTETEYFA